jgi:hypothetical protein
MAATMLAGCDSPADRSVRLCRDAMGRRVDDRNCGGGGGTAMRGAAFVYASERQRVPGIGQSITSYSANPGNGAIVSPEGRVIRGGLGGSARGSYGG